MAEPPVVFHRAGKTALAFFIILGLILLGAGTLLLYISFDVISEEGWVGALVAIPTAIVIVIASFLIQWKMSLLKSAYVSVDDQKVQYFEEGTLRSEVLLDQETQVEPLVNHALGFNAFFGFSVRRGKTIISMSPDEGWSLRDLRAGIEPLLATCLRHGCRISKVFERVRYGTL